MATNVWRNRPDYAEARDSANAIEFSVDQGVVGVDWAVNVPAGESLTWEEYKKEAEEAGFSEKQAHVRAMKAIHDNMEEGDLCYARDNSDQFYLGQVTGSWNYESDREFREHQIVNVRDCNWYQIDDPQETIPTELLDSFGRGAVLQRINNKRLVAFTQRLFEIRDDRKHYDINLPYTFDNWLSDDDLKDLLAIHLQLDKNKILIPSSVDQMPFLTDGVMVDQMTARRTTFQVQHRHDNLPRGAYELEERNSVYLRRDNESLDALPSDVQVLQLEDLVRVFEDHWDFLPRRLRIIADTLREGGNRSMRNTGEAFSASQNSVSEKDDKPVAAGFGFRNAVFLIAGFLFGLGLLASYANWTASPTNTIEKRQTVLEAEIGDLQNQNNNLMDERNELRKSLEAMESSEEERKSEAMLVSQAESFESEWFGIRIQQNDTLSGLLEKFQGSQEMLEEVIRRNNITNRDLIYTDSILSLPIQISERTNRIAQK